MKRTPEKTQEISTNKIESRIWDILSRTKKIVSDLSRTKNNKSKVSELEFLISSLEKSYLIEQNENAHKYKLVFDHINSWLGFSDTKTKKIVELNPKLCEIFEIDSIDYIGMDYPLFFNEFVIDKEEFERWKQLYIKNREISWFELTIKTKWGNKKNILVFSVGIKEINKEFFLLKLILINNF